MICFDSLNIGKPFNPHYGLMGIGKVKDCCKIITNKAILAATTREDEILIDSKGLVNAEAVESNGLEANGTDNTINLGSAHQTNEDFTFCFNYKSSNTSDNILGQREAIGNRLGLLFTTTADGYLRIIMDNNPLVQAVIEIVVNDNINHFVYIAYRKTNLIVYIDGIEGHNAPLAKTYTISGIDMFLFSRDGTNFGNSSISNFKFKNSYLTYAEIMSATTTLDKWLPMTESRGTGGTHTGVFEKISQSTLSLLGTVNSSNDVLQDVCHENINNGFTLNANGQYVPASLLNIGLDCEGNTLANPAIPNGYNGSENRFTLVAENAEITAADTNRFLTEEDGTLKIWDIKDIKGNYQGANYLYCLVKSLKDISCVFVFGIPLTIPLNILLGNCFACKDPIADGYAYVFDPTTKQYLIDTNTGQFLTKLI